MFYNLSDFLIKPNTEAERLFCKKYHIELKRLENGVTILGMPCRKDSTSWAEIFWSFSEGAYGNPPGTVHFFEHFFNKKINPIAELNNLHANAHTSQIETNEEISGIANPTMQDFGIWTVLKEVRIALENPLKTVDYIKKTIETEKQVVKAEVKRNEGDHDYQIAMHGRRVVYSPQNPISNSTLITGNEDEIDKITVVKMNEASKKVLVPKNLLINFYTEGDLEIPKEITKNLKSLFSDFPRVSEPKNSIDRTLLEKINPEFKQGTKYIHDHKLKNGIITTQFVWVLKNKFPSIEYSALIMLRTMIWSELHMYSRKMGWGYQVNAYLESPNDNIQILILRVDMRKDSSHELSKGIKQVLINVKTKTEFMIINERKRQKATPISITDRLSWMIDGIKEHNAMINADMNRRLMLEVGHKDLDTILDTLLSIIPAIIITGDLV